METLNLKSREQFVSSEIAAIQAALPNTFQFPVGSIVRALVDAHSTLAIWEESLIQFVNARCRLATSEGTDADSFVEDFGLTRLPGVAASGLVTFSSFSTTQIRFIPVGSIVSTQIDSISFIVTIDTTNPNYDPITNSYVMQIGIPSINVPVQCSTQGTVGNVSLNTIVIINSPITGVDTVTNQNDFTNGTQPQTDPQLRIYFVEYLNGLKRATKDALAFAILSVQSNLTYNLVENVDYATQTQHLGYFYAVIDDGTGNPPLSLLNSVASILDIYRGFTIAFEVHGPVVVTANISATVVTPVGYVNTNLVPNIQSALDIYISLIPFGETLFYTRIAQIIYNVIVDAVGSVTADQFNVTSILLNGGTADLVSTSIQKIEPGTITITLSS